MANKLYNEEIKERFLSTYDNIQTQKTLRNVFHNTELIESVLDKDLYDFTLDELGKAIENTNPHSKSVAMSTGRFISQFISWAIEPPQRLRKNAINPLKGVLPEWYENLVDATKKIHFSYSEFLGLLEDENMMNSQDKSYLFLMWYGILGEKFTELQQIKQNDIDFDTNEIFIKDRNQKIKVSDECIKYLERACREKTYYQYNTDKKEFNEKELLDSPFLFRNVKSPRGVENQKIGINVLYSRLHALKDILGLEYISPQSLRQSGMIKMSVDIYKRDGILAYDQLAEVGEKYNYSKLSNNGYEYYNTYLMREFINESNIKNLYNIDVEIKLR